MERVVNDVLSAHGPVEAQGPQRAGAPAANLGAGPLRRRARGLEANEHRRGCPPVRRDLDGDELVPRSEVAVLAGVGEGVDLPVAVDRAVGPGVW